MASGDINRWVSTSSNDFGTAGNWSLGTVPVAGEHVVFNANYGSAAVDGSDQSAIGLLGSVTVEEFHYNIGSSGNPLIFDVASGTGRVIFNYCPDLTAFISSKNGPMNVICNGSGINIAGGGINIHGDDVNGGFISNLITKAGQVNVAADCQIGTLCCVLEGSITTVAAKATHGGGDILVEGEHAHLTYNRLVDTTDQMVTVMNRGAMWATKAISGNTVEIRIGNGGRMSYTPDTDPSAAPNLYCDGIMDVRNSDYTIEFNNYIIGPRGRVLGSATLQTSASPLAISADMSATFP